MKADREKKQARMHKNALLVHPVKAGRLVVSRIREWFQTGIKEVIRWI